MTPDSNHKCYFIYGRCHQCGALQSKAQASLAAPAGSAAWRVSWLVAGGVENQFVWDAVWKTEQHIGQLMSAGIKKIIITALPPNDGAMPRA